MTKKEELEDVLEFVREMREDGETDTRYIIAFIRNKIHDIEIEEKELVNRLNQEL